MDTASPDDEREPAQLPPRRVAGPMTFSVLLHALLLLLFARTAFPVSSGAKSAEARPSIPVLLALRPQQPEPVLPVVPEAAPPAPAAAPPEPIAQTPIAEESTSEPEELTPGAILAETPAAESAPRIPAWTPERIRAAVEASGGELRSRLTAEWVEGCVLERKLRDTRDCTEQRQEQDLLSAGAAAGFSAGAGAFAGVTRTTRQRLLAEQFKNENYLLSGLVDAGGVVGELAASRYYLNRDYIIYLSGNRVNGNHNDLVSHAMQNFTADLLAGPQLSLTGDVPFSCRSKRIDYSLAPAGQVTFGNNVPCTYQYTGFSIERPAPDPDEFRVVPLPLGEQN